MRSTGMWVILTAALALPLALGGCGEGEAGAQHDRQPGSRGDASASPDASTSGEVARGDAGRGEPAGGMGDVDGETARGVDAGLGGEVEGASDEAAASGSSGSGEGEEPTAAEAFEAAMARVEAFEADAEFGRALMLCRQMRGRFRSGDQLRTISRKLSSLTEARNRSVGLDYSLGRLGASNSSAAREAARRRLVEAGEVGRVFLRKAVRDREPIETATAAAALLGELGDAKGAGQFVAMLADPPAEPLRGALVKAIESTAEKLDLASVVALAGASLDEAMARYRSRLREVLDGAAASAAFPPSEVEALFERSMASEGASARIGVEVLSRLYAEGAGRERGRFEAMFETGGDRLGRLRAFAAEAEGSADASTSAWGEAAARRLMAFDAEAARRGLVAWWGFDDEPGGKLADAGGRGHAAKIIGSPPKRVEGVVGRALLFDGTNRGVESLPTDGEAFGKLHQNSYSFAAWVKPTALPSGEQPDIYGGIAIKEGWHLGLSIRSDGRFMANHYYKHRDGAHATSKSRVGVGRWHHIVLSVDLDQRLIRFYLDGKPDGEERFGGKGRYWDLHDGRPLRIGLARFGPGNYAYRFDGAIDEVAVYRRALSEGDALSLYRVQSKRLRDRLTTKAD